MFFPYTGYIIHNYKGEKKCDLIQEKAVSKENTNFPGERKQIWNANVFRLELSVSITCTASTNFFRIFSTTPHERAGSYHEKLQNRFFPY